MSSKLNVRVGSSDSLDRDLLMVPATVFRSQDYYQVVYHNDHRINSFIKKSYIEHQIALKLDK